MFGRKGRLPPTVTGGGLTLVYDAKSRYWSLQYRDIDFMFPGNAVAMPTVDELDGYIARVEAHQDRIDRAVNEMAEGWDDSVIDGAKAHTASIEVESPERIAATVLGDESWGDLGYDLWIENGEIVNSGFSD